MSMMQQNLAGAISREVTDQSIRQAAEMSGEKLQRKDGIGRAVGYIQAFLVRKPHPSKKL